MTLRSIFVNRNSFRIGNNSTYRKEIHTTNIITFYDHFVYWDTGPYK